MLLEETKPMLRDVMKAAFTLLISLRSYYKIRRYGYRKAKILEQFRYGFQVIVGYKIGKILLQ